MTKHKRIPETCSYRFKPGEYLGLLEVARRRGIPGNYPVNQLIGVIIHEACRKGLSTEEFENLGLPPSYHYRGRGRIKRKRGVETTPIHLKTANFQV